MPYTYLDPFVPTLAAYKILESPLVAASDTYIRAFGV